MKAVFVLLAVLIVGAVAEEDAKFKDWKEKQSKAIGQDPKDNIEQTSEGRVRSSIVRPKNVKSAGFPKKVRGATAKPPPASVTYVR